MFLLYEYNDRGIPEYIGGGTAEECDVLKRDCTGMSMRVLPDRAKKPNGDFKGGTKPAPKPEGMPRYQGAASRETRMVSDYANFCHRTRPATVSFYSKKGVPDAFRGLLNPGQIIQLLDDDGTVVEILDHKLNPIEKEDAA